MLNHKDTDVCSLHMFRRMKGKAKKGFLYVLSYISVHEAARKANLYRNVTKTRGRQVENFEFLKEKRKYIFSI